MTPWTQELDQVWLNEMIHQANVLGKRSNSGFKKEAWGEALKKLNLKPGCSFTMAQLKSHNATLREQYSIISTMAEASGMGWESDRCLVVCLDTTWDAYLSTKPKKYQQWKNKPFPLFHLCESLYKGTLATGKGSRVAGSLQKRTSSTVSEDGHSDTNADMLPVVDFGQHVPRPYFDLDYSDNDEVVTTNDGLPSPLAHEQSSSRRAPPSPRSPPPKRHRGSLGGDMLAEMKKQKEETATQFDLLCGLLQSSPKTASKELTRTEQAVGILQSEFASMPMQRLVAACDVFEIESNASVFLQLKGDLRIAWLEHKLGTE
ncbi:hypothetical protein H257_16263 [Aphanomyces astaci]|uniref:Myb/SANT-like domain-containing protein n=1 Tax=Aphanomyces astaci TaxID=112090 RepID=W4FJ52_APHAT|nr:hypothetical protein H257_16263 [Aphanomyces astaci]ETV67532.1 hypothetical protein H257_16263 [Aphanomyces astaci]|eukprot:XP_009842936.1 hypothetical protein H257_16263 [Aphanomyces astaci]